MFRTQSHQSSPIRIDKFLASQLKEVSREYIQELIAQKLVYKNEALVQKSKEMVSLGDIVTINSLDLKKDLYSNTITAEVNSIVEQVKVIYEHPDFIILTKPAGLLVHKTNHPQSYSLVDYLLQQYPEIGTIRDASYGPEALAQQRYGVVHRLDKDTSGVMVLARTQQGYDTLKYLFQQRMIIKEYLCLVAGKLSQSHGHIRYPIVRSRLDHTKRVAVVSPRQGQTKQRLAHTEYYVESSYSNSSLLRIILHTGRTHQIRVHLQATGHPILGDKLYGGKLERQNQSLNRQFLHATRLAFEYAGDYYNFESELADDLQTYLAQIAEL